MTVTPLLDWLPLRPNDLVNADNAREVLRIWKEHADAWSEICRSAVERADCNVWSEFGLEERNALFGIPEPRDELNGIRFDPRRVDLGDEPEKVFIRETECAGLRLMIAIVVAHRYRVESTDDLKAAVGLARLISKASREAYQSDGHSLLDYDDNSIVTTGIVFLADRHRLPVSERLELRDRWGLRAHPRDAGDELQAVHLEVLIQFCKANGISGANLAQIDFRKLAFTYLETVLDQLYMALLQRHRLGGDSFPLEVGGHVFDELDSPEANGGLTVAVDPLEELLERAKELDPNKPLPLTDLIQQLGLPETVRPTLGTHFSRMITRESLVKGTDFEEVERVGPRSAKYQYYPTQSVLAGMIDCDSVAKAIVGNGKS